MGFLYGFLVILFGTTSKVVAELVAHHGESNRLPKGVRPIDSLPGYFKI